MIQSNQKTSLLIPSQLPAFVRDNPDYGNFVLFLQAYYEWLEQQGNVTDRSKNILNYKDIDNTSSEFLQYFYNEFLSYFPQSLLDDLTTNKATLIKIARELYQSKGTTASYKFLFRLLFNTDVEFFFTKDAVLRASTGTWYIAKYLNVLTTDTNFSNITNFKIFGETSQSIANIENSVVGLSKSQIYINNLQRGFQSGEFVRIIDQNNQDVYFLNGQQVSANTPGANILRSKVVGQVNQVLINPKHLGSFYQVNDPISFYNGLSSDNGHGASAYVGSVTTGSLQSLTVSNGGGYGYRSTPNSSISFSVSGPTPVSPSAIVPVYGVNTNFPANVAFLPADTIGSIAGNGNIYIGNTAFSQGAKPKGNSIYYFANNSLANGNTSLANAFSFISFTTYPISTVVLTGQGSGLNAVQSIVATSLYQTSNNLSANVSSSDLKNVGILAPIQIVSGGLNYSNNDIIVIVGGTGFGAYGNVSVNANGTIITTRYTYNPLDTNTLHRYPLGGMGYTSASLPVATVQTSTGSGSSLVIPGVLGDGAKFSSTTSSIGQVQSIIVTDYGQDYIGVPNASLAIQDIYVSNVTSGLVPVKGDFVQQSGNTYTAYVDSITSYGGNYILRVYNYFSSPSPALPLNIIGKNIHMNIVTNNLPSSRYSSSGVLTYGDGTALADVSFTNGLVSAQGQYLDTTGQPSSFDVLQSIDYNNFTYELTAEKEIAVYRKTLLDLLHPAGMKMLGRYRLNSANNVNTNIQEALYQGHTLANYVGSQAIVTIYPDPTFVNPSNNIIQLSSIGNGVNIGTFIFANSFIRFSTPTGQIFLSKINSINYSANSVIAKENVWTTFANVATVSVNSGSNLINIISLTGSYDIINGGSYTNSNVPLIDVVKSGDSVFVNNQANVVSSVDYVNNVIMLTGTGYTYNANGYMSVNRTYTTNSAIYVQIFGPLGTTYIPELVDETTLNNIITEDGNIILLG